jgi:hypothetical protein
MSIVSIFTSEHQTTFNPPLCEAFHSDFKLPESSSRIAEQFSVGQHLFALNDFNTDQKAVSDFSIDDMVIVVMETARSSNRKSPD